MTRLGAIVACTSLVSWSCADPDDEAKPCIDAIRDLAVDEPAGGYGHSAKLVMAEVAGSYTATLWWFQSETTTEVTLEIDPEILAARFVKSDANPKYLEHGIQNCYDRVEFDARIQFNTADGAFDETWIAVFEATSSQRDIADLRVDFVEEDIQGSYEPADGPKSQVLRMIAVVMPNATADKPKFLGNLTFPERDGDDREDAFWPPRNENM